MSESFDILVRNAKIVDGSGKPAFGGSIGIKGEKIVALGNVSGEAVREIDGAGLVACPGFIDIHSHGDMTLLQYPLAENFVMQGITTFVGGNCGHAMAPIEDFWPVNFSIFSAPSWWREVEPHSYGPPYFLSLERYGKILEEKLGFAIDWRTFGEYLAKVETMGISVNYVPLVGHNAVRLAVMGMDFKRRAKPAEIEAMKKHVEEAMTSGAFGLGVGLDGGPGDFANTEELVELAKVANRHGGIYASHTRNFDNNYPSTNPEEWGYGICHNITPDEMPAAKYYGYMEAIEVARKAKVPVEISHIVPAYTIYHFYPEFLQIAAAKATLDLITRARQEGLDVNFDLAPVDPDVHGVFRGAIGLTELFSKWIIQAGSKRQFVENLKMKEFRSELKKEIMGGKFKFLMIHPKTDTSWMDRPYVVSCKYKDYEGKTIRELALRKNADPMDMLFDMIIEDPDMKVNFTDPRWTKATLQTFIESPDAVLGTDLMIYPFSEKSDYAREPPLGAWGMVPRYLRTFVKEETVVSLEAFVHKFTNASAQRIGLNERGTISPGAYADLLLFDFDAVTDKGTWLNPHQAPEGIHYTIVNGEIIYANMTHTGVKSGKVVRHVR